MTGIYLPIANPIGPIVYRILKNINVNSYEIISTRKKGACFPKWLVKNNSEMIEQLKYENIFEKIKNKLLEKIKFAYHLVKNLRVNYEVILSITMPEGYHKFAYIYKILHPKVKWIAFFSDPYSNSPFQNYNYKIIKNRFYLFNLIKRECSKIIWEIKKKLFLLEEKIVFKYADKIIYVSETQREFCYKKRDKKEKTMVIPFYYLSEWKEKINQHIAQKNNYNKNLINLIHPGNIYGNRKVDEFLKALENFEGKIHCYNCGEFDKSLLKEYKIENTVTSLGFVNYETLLENIKEANYIIIIDSFFENIKNPYMPSKVVDAMYFDKPIIAITDEGSELDKFCKITGNLSIKNNKELIQEKLMQLINNELKIKPNYSMYCDLIFDII
ncbi:MAG: glycosyltransferase [Cetobacterium sp.]